MSFHNLGLSKPLLDALAAKNYAQATPIQSQAIPTVLTGRDLLGIAQTGTGKTAAFMLPSLDRLAANRNIPKPGQIRMLVLAPTRELASQIADSAQTYGRFMRLSVGVIFGGVPNSKSVRTVARGLDVLVATPGRLLDLIDQRALSLRELEILVLDEADQMLDLGFIHALKRIVSLVPAKRQTLFFSATMPKAIKELADRYLTNPAEVAVTPVAKTADRVQQKVVLVNQAEKTALLTMFLRSEQTERTLVFSRTKHGADKIVRLLEAAGNASNAIHGNKSQAQRERALAQFRSGEVSVLIATDIAARGIDIPGVSHVINYDLPEVPEQYVHRIGRTARAGAEGKAIAFCSPDERGLLRDIERLTRQKVDVAPLPEDFLQQADALKRLKPAPKAEQPRRAPSRGFKAGRRADGQRRENRNDRSGQRQEHRSERPAGQRSEHRNERSNQDRSGQPRSGQQRTDRPQQRHPHRGEGHPAHRPEGGRPKPFGGRGRRRPSGAHRAQG
ncbi:DEAD/DEAH box helicase [Sphingomonas sp. SM33]|uniref:DEAD/DEAH box helicase n=1 Tax=Sphingomonas telluris TaxID=2907998 RepID=A0ABS9VQJ7_9SPHN|nr:DEAD/DEAH box helicase [Sphingomonas telluris]MCH8616789.1 DEAD/DEAH box helicase [Sphingomonas telluris]